MRCQMRVDEDEAKAALEGDGYPHGPLIAEDVGDSTGEGRGVDVGDRIESALRGTIKARKRKGLCSERSTTSSNI